MSREEHGDGAAFLLAQIGHHAASLFAEKIRALDLTPPHAGILRAIAATEGQSQQALSAQLGLLPSRVVAYIDDLEGRGYVERRRNPDDRRLYSLYLTSAGTKVMGRIGELARDHERQLTAGLTVRQRDTLRRLLSIVADEQKLTPHVHPGFRNIGRAERARSQANRVISTTTSRSVDPSPE
ncbi:MarR family winged helix-turn-helix transcriptional regulator [Mycobacterium sp. 1164985.4]|uniref:MarR family winged helix-turn-helix transcriptional regulator n=1 Tax=Mycobacterium sp. 1164985.4 TaxID=1834069 RepID=UPI001E5C770E|nr:MarR family winged helix-turn-helix transcriptional regulator [Mycobacterium sp. 1164985.4]